MAQLVNQRIGLIGNAFSISIDIDSCEAGGLNGMLAKIPYLVQHRIRRSEITGLFIEAVMIYLLLNYKIFNGHFQIFQLTIAKGHNDAE